MAITTSIESQAIRASKEDFYIRVVSDTTTMVVAGAAERYRITFSAIPGIGDTLSFDFDGNTHVVEFVDPTIPGEQLSSFPQTILCPTATTGTIAEFLENNLIPILQSAQVFSIYTIFKTGTSGLNFESVLNTENRLDNAVASGFGITATHLVDGLPDTLNSDYYIKAQIAMTSAQNTGYFNLISPWLYFKPQIFDGECFVDFNIKDVLDGMMEELDVNSPTGSGSNVVYSARDFFIRIAEHYGSTPESIPCFVSKKWKLLKGGRRFNDKASLASEYSGKFLTLRNAPYVDRRLRDWLYFFENGQTAGSTYKMRATVKGVWGTSAGQNYTTITLDGGVSVHRVPCGYDQLGLQALLGAEEPMYYDIEIYKFVGGVITDLVIGAFRFYVLPESDTRMGIHYFNFLGLMEAQCLDAETIYSNSWDKELVEISAPRESVYTGQKLEVHKQRAIDSSQQMELSVNTGPLSPVNWVAAQDIMMSERIWFANLNEGTDRVSAQVVKGSEKMVPYSQDGVNHHSLAFKIQFNQEKGNSVPAAITT